MALRQQISDLLGESRRSEANGLKLAQPNEANLLSQGFSLYKHEQMLENWSTRTAAQNDVTFLQRLELIGDLPVMAVTKSVVRDYGKYYLTIPLIGTRVTNHTSADKGGIRSN